MTNTPPGEAQIAVARSRTAYVFTVPIGILLIGSALPLTLDVVGAKEPSELRRSSLTRERAT